MSSTFSCSYFMNQMPRYQRTEFDEDRASGSDNSTSTVDGTVIFPPDITKGFSNPNSDFDVVFKSSDTNGFGNNQDHDSCITGSPLHPMVHITRPSSKNSSATSGARSSLRFFKGKVLRPFGFDVLERGSSSSRRPSFIWSRMTLLEKILFMLCVVLSMTVIFLALFLIQRTPHLIPYSLTPSSNSSKVSTKGKINFPGISFFFNHPCSSHELLFLTPLLSLTRVFCLSILEAFVCQFHQLPLFYPVLPLHSCFPATKHINQNC